MRVVALEMNAAKVGCITLEKGKKQTIGSCFSEPTTKTASSLGRTDLENQSTSRRRMKAMGQVGGLGRTAGTFIQVRHQNDAGSTIPKARGLFQRPAHAPIMMMGRPMKIRRPRRVPNNDDGEIRPIKGKFDQRNIRGR